MSTRSLGIIGALAVLLVVGGAVLWQRGPAPPAEPISVAPEPEPEATEPTPLLDVAGLPPLFPEGMDHPKSEISLDEYFAQYGAEAAYNPEANKFREDLEPTLQDELIGKQVTWEGYIQRIEDAPSGRVMLVITPDPEKPGLNAAMIKYSAGLSEQIHAYNKGDRVRVVAVYDKLMTVIPSLRGISVELIEAAGLTSSDSAG
jgi:hypothetical protein